MTETHPVKNGMNSWQRIAVIIGVISAISAPILMITYNLAERNAMLDSVCLEVKDLKDNIREMRREMRELSDTVLRIRSNSSNGSNIGSGISQARNP